MKKTDKKVKKTQERMKKIRIERALKLQEDLENAYDWVKQEKEKLLGLIENLKKQLDSYEKLLLKLEGAELALAHILDSKEQDEVWLTDIQKSEQDNS